MTHYDIDYSKSPAPAFDAVQDIIDYLGKKKYNEISPMISLVTHCGQFTMYCSLAGIKGFPVRAWYEHYHGEGTWKQEEVDGL